MSEATATSADPYIGKELPQKSFTITDALIDDYFEGLNLDRGNFDANQAPVPSMIASDSDNYFRETAYAQQRGHLWMRQQWSFLKPLAVGGRYATLGHIEDIYKKRDRTVVNAGYTLFNEAGEAILTANHHQSFLLDAPVTQVNFRKPNEKAGAKKFIVPEGEAIAGFEQTITLEMCGQYFHGDKNYHTDLAASKDLGFSDVVVGGRMTMAYIGHLLDGHFGPEWFESGELDVKFTNPCWPDDRIAVKGIATGEQDGRDCVFAWIEKQDGTVVLIANASVERSEQ